VAEADQRSVGVSADDRQRAPPCARRRPAREAGHTKDVTSL
jgi:hypothetical protein